MLSIHRPYTRHVRVAREIETRHFIQQRCARNHTLLLCGLLCFVIFLKNLQPISKLCSNFSGVPLALWIFCHECSPSHKLHRCRNQDSRTSILRNLGLPGTQSVPQCWLDKVSANWRLGLSLGCSFAKLCVRLKIIVWTLKTDRQPGVREMMVQEFRKLCDLPEDQS